MNKGLIQRFPNTKLMILLFFIKSPNSNAKYRYQYKINHCCKILFNILYQSLVFVSIVLEIFLKYGLKLGWYCPT